MFFWIMTNIFKVLWRKILDHIQMEHKKSKKKSNGNNEYEKSDADINMSYAVLNKIKINE